MTMNAPTPPRIYCIPATDAPIETREPIEVDFLAVFLYLLDRRFLRLLGLLDDLLHRRARAGHPAERFHHRPLGRDHGHDIELGPLPQIVQGKDVQRIGHRNKEFVT